MSPAMLKRGVLVVAAILEAAVCVGCGSSAEATAEKGPPHVVGGSKEEIGKYIVMMASCNDCHTPGGMMGPVPTSTEQTEWLTGSKVGFRGPWGTTYPANLRHKLKPYLTAEMFIKAMRVRTDKPPMPWSALHAMSDADLGAVYAYIKSLPDAGVDMPDAVPAGMDPGTAYISMERVLPGGATQPRTGAQ